MGKGGHCKKKEDQQQKACVLCTAGLLAVIIIIVVVYFALLRPRDPKVQVPSIQLLSLSTGSNVQSNGQVQSANLNLQISIYNPNRADFWVEDGSTACIYYAGQQIGFTPIPPTIIPSQSFGSVAVQLSSNQPIQLIPFSSIPNPNPNSYTYNTNYGPTYGHDSNAQCLPLSTSVTIVGHVTTAGMFFHHSYVISKCNLTISVSPPSRAYIQSCYCHGSYSVDE